MNKILISLIFSLGFSFANAATHGAHVDGCKASSTNSLYAGKAKNMVRSELPFGPVGSFRGGLF